MATATKITNDIYVKVSQRPAPKKVSASPHISILPNDYSNLVNLPTINGYELSGDMTHKELNLLSAAQEDYESVETTRADDEEKYFLMLGEDNSPLKVSVKTAAVGMAVIKTGEEIDADAAVGTYQFIEKKREEIDDGNSN